MNKTLLREHLNNALSNDAIYKAALTWYDEANDLAFYLTTLSRGLDMEQASCVIAALSIRQTWNKNVEYAIDFANGKRAEDMPVLNSIKTILTNIINYEDPFEALRGLKTNSFAWNIYGESHFVTNDTWMIKAAGMTRSGGLNKTEYRAMTEYIRELAAENDIPAAAAQAAIWISVRGGAK